MSSDTTNTQQSEIDSQRVKYLDLTSRLNNYNEIYTVNSYIKGANNSELDRLNSSNNTIKSKILRMKQEYLLRDHDLKEYKYRINILYLTVIIVSFILILVTFYSQNKLNIQLLATCIGVISIVYLIILMFSIKSNINRRSNAFDQYYWTQAKDITN